MDINTAIEITGLSKEYKIGKAKDDSLRFRLGNLLRSSKSNNESFFALNDISLSFKKGDVVGIVGKNGAGKSTLLKILSQITKPSKGVVKINGRMSSLLEVGTGFHPELTGRENIFLNGTILGMSREEIKTKFDDIVAFSGIKSFLDTPVKHYSSGMYVRLAFSVAAHLDPDILVIDEVLAVGDSEFQNKCLGKMQDVANDGKTVLFVSHNMAAVKALCNKAILIDHGKLIAEGSVDLILRKYQESISFDKSISTNLDAVAGRKGAQEIQFKEISTYLASEGIKVYPRSGQKVVFELTIDSSKIEDIDYKDLQVDIGIDDELGTRICWISSTLVKDKILGDKIQYIFDKFPLNKGNYSTTVFMSYKGKIQDWIKNCHQFSVESGEFYETGKLPPDSQGIRTLIDYKIR